MGCKVRTLLNLWNWICSLCQVKNRTHPPVPCSPKQDCRARTCYFMALPRCAFCSSDGWTHVKSKIELQYKDVQCESETHSLEQQYILLSCLQQPQNKNAHHLEGESLKKYKKKIRLCTPAHKCPECVQPRLSLDRVSLIALHISTCTGDGALATRLTH